MATTQEKLAEVKELLKSRPHQGAQERLTDHTGTGLEKLREELEKQDLADAEAEFDAEAGRAAAALYRTLPDEARAYVTSQRRVVERDIDHAHARGKPSDVAKVWRAAALKEKALADWKERANKTLGW